MRLPLKKDGVINTTLHLFGRLTLVLVLGSILLLPASNTGLPLSSHTWVQALLLAALGFHLAWRVLSDAPRSEHELSCWALALLVTAYGWLMTCFPSAMIDQASGMILPLDAERWRSFGTMDAIVSSRAMITVSAMMVLFVLSVHFGSRRRDRTVLATAVTLSGVVVSTAGLWLQTGADRSAFWQVAHVPSSVFGLFWYHGNAAAYLNLAWPAGVWLLLHAARSDMRPVVKNALLAALAAAVILHLVAVVVNVSKMGHIMLLVECLLMAGVLYGMHWRHASQGTTGLTRYWMIAGAVLVLVGLGAWLTGAEQGWSRWNVFSGRGFDDPARRHAAMMALRMGLDAGWTGIGPGTFEGVSPHYSTLDPLIQGGRWRYAHNDYAQFFAEWGALGSLLLAALLVPPLRGLLRQLRASLSAAARKTISSQRRTGLACFLPAVLVTLTHALVDFPLQIMATQFLFVVQAGLLVALSQRPSQQRNGLSRKQTRGGSTPETLSLKQY